MMITVPSYSLRERVCLYQTFSPANMVRRPPEYNMQPYVRMFFTRSYTQALIRKGDALDRYRRCILPGCSDAWVEARLIGLSRGRVVHTQFPFFEGQSHYFIYKSFGQKEWWGDTNTIKDEKKTSTESTETICFLKSRSGGVLVCLNFEPVNDISRRWLLPIGRYNR